MLYNKEGKVLLQHRTDDAPRQPGFWSAFGGGIEAGETPEEALRRELEEELEYEVRNPQLLAVEAFTDALGTGYNYVEAYDETQIVVLHEGQGYGWFTFAETRELPMSPYRRKMLQKLEAYLAGR